ncbi:MAG: hypothetical protein JW955_22075 [Sedimentisphaerales bacterium]|nr:hypothetical protein [Sedimentisphaerales bacterium]
MTTTPFAPSLEMKENAEFLLLPVLAVQEATSDASTLMLSLDGTIELNAPLCRTYVVIFARYWVSSCFYRATIVWAEPHVGSLNYPVYPPTLNVASDPNQFVISHQLQHMYDGAFPKPLGERGPFKHKFNVYYISDIRFAEREALDLRVRLSDVQPLIDVNGQGGEQVVDVPYPQASAPRKDHPAKMTVRATGSRVDEATLLNADGELLKGVQYEYIAQEGAKRLKRQAIFLPERPITVAFKGEGPTITIGGRKRHYRELEIMDPPGGRKCVVDHQAIEFRGRAVNLPSQIEVYTGDGEELLRRARMYSVALCESTPEQGDESARQFSLFDPNEMRCRDLFIKYWLKALSEVANEDIEALERLRKHFGEISSAATTIGEQLKRVNMLLQVDWMLDNADGLAEDFREHVRLLRSGGLARMILYGGENLIETTSRWGQPDTADKLLGVWLDAAVAENDVASVLDFASARVTGGHLWTSAKLLEALGRLALSSDQRFLGEALRCTALSRIDEMVRKPNDIRNEVDIAQARWALWRTTEDRLHEELKASLAAAQKAFGAIDRPTRRDEALKRQLDAIEQNLLGDRSIRQ